MALEAYRAILRAARIAFHGDQRVLTAAFRETRSQFDQHRLLTAGDPLIKQKIAEAQEVARLLRQNIVQGEALPGGQQNFQLRIHPEIERGDNEADNSGFAPSVITGQCGKI